MRGARRALAGGLLGSLVVANAYRPLLRRWPISVVGAAPSFVASESPWLLAGLHTVAAAVSARAGGRLGALGLAANVAGLVGLAGLAGDARRSAEVLARALDAADVDGAEELPTGHPPRVLPGRVARRRYRRVADISYSEHGPFGTLDVWHRADLPLDGRAPVLLQVHGGAWQYGDKRDQAEPLLGYLAERGWVCVTVNYRLAPGALWPAMIVDVKRAIAWVREHISGHGGDPEFIAVTGGSAGGHLAALAALSANDPDFQPGFTDVDTSLAAAVPLYGVHDFTRDRQGLFALLQNKIIGTAPASDERTWRQASPALRVGSDAPPFLVIHGTTDAIVGVEQSRRLVAALRAGSPSPVGYAELPHAQHGFDTFATERTAHTVTAIHHFLTTVHRRAMGARAGETERNTIEAAR